MKVVVLGGSGHIGQRLLAALTKTKWAETMGASRHVPKNPDVRWRQLNSCNRAELQAALQGVDAVVNCVAGDGPSIAEGARVLVQAALQAGRPRIIHLSTQSVYGEVEGNITEDTPLGSNLGWYGHAKCEAETYLHLYAQHNGEAVIVRLGCVYGPGSQLWVGRIGRWLQAGRLGDLGIMGDGWSNLVHVDDVCNALMALLRSELTRGEISTFNLAAPDSPRWNEYFVDLALAIGATPVRRIGRQIQLDAWLAGPPLKFIQLAMKKLGQSPTALPDPLPPGLLRLWSQHIQLDAGAAKRQLNLNFTPYAGGLASSVEWFLQQQERLKK
jgi:nucleoside-diphosphate-sugar epimerase